MTGESLIPKVHIPEFLVSITGGKDIDNGTSSISRKRVNFDRRLWPGTDQAKAELEDLSEGTKGLTVSGADRLK